MLTNLSMLITFVFVTANPVALSYCPSAAAAVVGAFEPGEVEGGPDTVADGSKPTRGVAEATVPREDRNTNYLCSCSDHVGEWTGTYASQAAADADLKVYCRDENNDGVYGTCKALATNYLCSCSDHVGEWTGTYASQAAADADLKVYCRHENNDGVYGTCKALA